jgi:stage IV sporulation protein B
MEGKRYRRGIAAFLLIACLLCRPVFADWSQTRLVPAGETIGIHVDATGLLVVGIAEVETANGRSSPAWDAGIRIGDILMAVGSRKVNTIQELRESLSENTGEVSVRVIRDGREMQLSVIPIFTPDGEGELGLWLRSGISGLGTMTYYDPENRQFGALGHGVSDAETGIMIPLLSGKIGMATVDTIERGEKGKPGEAKGKLGFDAPVGTVERNTEFGIFGVITEGTAADSRSTLEICPLRELHCGPAQILSDISGTMTAYRIEISRIYPENDGGRDLLITVTDPSLLELTGGIVQGMSGSPILQNDRIAGAVTHVLVNDPTRGYGIGIERMLEAAH